MWRGERIIKLKRRKKYVHLYFFCTYVMFIIGNYEWGNFCFCGWLVKRKRQSQIRKNLNKGNFLIEFYNNTFLGRCRIIPDPKILCNSFHWRKLFWFKGVLGKCGQQMKCNQSNFWAFVNLIYCISASNSGC